MTSYSCFTLSIAIAGTCLSFGATQSPNKHPALITTCQVMPQVVMDINTVLNTTGTGIACTLSTNCTQIQCKRPTQRIASFMLEIQACRDPLTLRIVRFNDLTGRMMYESVLYRSQMIGVNLGYGFVTLNFTLAPRSTRLSLGLKVCTS